MSAAAIEPRPDPRADALNHWLREIDPGFAPAWPLGSDASFRRYFRSQRGGQGVVIMDAPPEREDIGPFLRVAGILHALDLRAPQILASDRARGFILLEDLGDRTFTRALAAGVSERALYRLAADTLQALQTGWARQAPALPERGALPAYDADLLLREVRLFVDWYWPEVRGHAADAEVRTAFEQAWNETLAALPELPPTLVLRDFHVDNLMLLPDAQGIESCGLLDFQDAVVGSPAYDLVSLLEDARRDVSPGVQTELLDAALAAGSWPRSAFLHHYRVLGVQRTVKIIGIFTRLARRDGKPGYQVHQPRLWRLLDRGLRAPEVAPVARWFHSHFDRAGRPCAQ
ncbi:aminoglycoside phosphotransferase [Thioalkalivibrio nitratireducens DSM 14787]|uniref:Aminoglycoside phosphotransferase n=1 Tax=Thioalkalivibrio nitratireducens (strain DSM 14787 / UNIQEM 213 / ALEN2) TaxID=1255043 RepID=L0DR68_THIND|nr:phosphotransferase [Thioalkalivibrio nitratireducens]AGA32084.1 aminoglycoside phosphotransferase [Thioalkalivibrio nitratireducens DSM 14787]